MRSSQRPAPAAASAHLLQTFTRPFGEGKNPKCDQIDHRNEHQDRPQRRKPDAAENTPRRIADYCNHHDEPDPMKSTVSVHPAFHHLTPPAGIVFILPALRSSLL